MVVVTNSQLASQVMSLHATNTVRDIRVPNHKSWGERLLFEICRYLRHLQRVCIYDKTPVLRSASFWSKSWRSHGQFRGHKWHWEILFSSLYYSTERMNFPCHPVFTVIIQPSCLLSHQLLGDWFQRLVWASRGCHLSLRNWACFTAATNQARDTSTKI